MKKLNFLLLILALNMVALEVSAMKSTFLQQSMTDISSENAMTQPSLLAFIDPKWRISASGNALTQTQYDSTAFVETAKTPLNISSFYLATGKGTSKGGIGFVIKSNSSQLDLNASTNSQGTTTQSKFFSTSAHLTAGAALGYLINQNWSMGISAGIDNFQNRTVGNSAGSFAGNQFLTSSENDRSLLTASAVLGTVWKRDDFLLSFSISPPEAILNSESQYKSSTLFTGGLSSNPTNEKTAPFVETSMSIGSAVKFAVSSNFLFHLQHSYVATGAHSGVLGFEVLDSKISYLGSFTFSETKTSISKGFTLGFVKTDDNVRWGMGPMYQRIYSRSPNSSSANTYSLAYVSEIGF